MLYFYFVLVDWGCTTGAIYLQIFVSLNILGEKHLWRSPQTDFFLDRVRQWAVPKLYLNILPLNASLNTLPLGRNKGSSRHFQPCCTGCPGLAFLSLQSPLLATSSPSPSCWGREGRLERPSIHPFLFSPLNQLMWKASPFNTILLFRLCSKPSSFLGKEGLFIIFFPLQIDFLSTFQK